MNDQPGKKWFPTPRERVKIVQALQAALEETPPGSGFYSYRGGATDQTIAAALGVNPSSVTGMRREGFGQFPPRAKTPPAADGAGLRAEVARLQFVVRQMLAAMEKANDTLPGLFNPDLFDHAARTLAASAPATEEA